MAQSSLKVTPLEWLTICDLNTLWNQFVKTNALQTILFKIIKSNLTSLKSPVKCYINLGNNFVPQDMTSTTDLILHAVNLEEWECDWLFGYKFTKRQFLRSAWHCTASYTYPTEFCGLKTLAPKVNFVYLSFLIVIFSSFTAIFFSHSTLFQSLTNSFLSKKPPFSTF